MARLGTWRNDWRTACAQVAVKPYLIFENGYEYTPPGTPKPPTASQVPDVIQGAVEMSIFNPGTAPITVRPTPWCCFAAMASFALLTLQASCLGLPLKATTCHALLQLSWVAEHGACSGISRGCELASVEQCVSGAALGVGLCWEQGNPGTLLDSCSIAPGGRKLRLRAQAPYTIQVASAQYKELLNVYNANLLSNLTAAGTAAFTVVNAYQNVQPNYNNVVQITYTVSSKSQVTPAPWLCAGCRT